MPRQVHDNAYYLRKIRGKRPDLHADVLDGKLTISQARKLAGLGGARTRLHELKNAWKKATPKEQSDFLFWAGLAPPTTPPASATGSAFDVDGVMLDWARRRIPEIMSRRRLSFGEVADELGLKRLNPSVMNAVRNGTRIKSTATASAIDAWLAKNVSV